MINSYFLNRFFRNRSGLVLSLSSEAGIKGKVSVNVSSAQPTTVQSLCYQKLPHPSQSVYRTTSKECGRINPADIFTFFKYISVLSVELLGAWQNCYKNTHPLPRYGIIRNAVNSCLIFQNHECV